jgi:hypothetical protein
MANEDQTMLEALPKPVHRLVITHANGSQRTPAADLDNLPEFTADHETREAAAAERERLNALGYSVQQYHHRWALLTEPDGWSSGDDQG